MEGSAPSHGVPESHFPANHPWVSLNRAKKYICCNVLVTVILIKETRDCGEWLGNGFVDRIQAESPQSQRQNELGASQ